METAFTTSAPVVPGYVPRLLTGIDPLDQSWGGFYRGGSYLVYGRATSGRDLIPLRFLQVGASMGESGLVISPSRPKDLMIQSASIGFNLRQAYEQGTVRLMRIPPVLTSPGDDDSGLFKALRDLVALIRQHRPQRLIINDFMPFVAFRSYDHLRTAFVEMLEQTDVLDMTMVLVMPQPANAQSGKVIDFMRSQMTGTVHVEMDADHPESTERRLVLLPNIGHLQRQTVEPWDLQDIVETAPPRTWAGSHRLTPSPPPPTPLPTVTPTPLGDTAAAPAPSLAAPPVQGFAPVPLGANRRMQAGASSGSEPARLGRPEARPAAPVAETPIPLGARATPRPSSAPLDLSGNYISSSERGARAVSAPAAPAAPSSREAFAEKLRPYFQQRGSGGSPFLLVGMRINPDARQGPFDFETISDIVGEALRPNDHLFIDAAGERLVVVLDGTAPEQQQTFFAGLKARLREQVPHQAESLLQAVSAFVVPNGHPFDTASDFLTYVLEAD